MRLDEITTKCGLGPGQEGPGAAAAGELRAAAAAKRPYGVRGRAGRQAAQGSAMRCDAWGCRGQGQVGWVGGASGGQNLTGSIQAHWGDEG